MKNCTKDYSLSRDEKKELKDYIYLIRIYEFLEKDPITKKELARRLGRIQPNDTIPEPTLNKYMSKKDPVKMPLDYIVRFAKYFKVSTDWLLGLTDIKTPDLNVRDICEKTGLSEEAIDVIGNQLAPELQETLSRFIEGAAFKGLLTGISDITNQKNLYNQYVCDKAKEIYSADDIHAYDIIGRASLINETTIFENNNASAGTKLMSAKEYVDVLQYKLANTFERLINEVAYSKEFDVNTFERIIQLINSEGDASVNQTKIKFLEMVRDGIFQKKYNPQVIERMQDKR